jgi:hypothetical protein
VTLTFGFRIVGDLHGRRVLVDSARALVGYAACYPGAQVDREGYLSAFRFGKEFADLLRTTGSCRGFGGACDAPYLWWDIDRPGDLLAGQDDARRLVGVLLERYRDLDEDDLLLFFSGSKGFHVGLPICWPTEPSVFWHRAARRFAEALAELAGVRVDGAVYDKVRAFRAPNSRHPRSGLYKRALSHRELMGLTVDSVQLLAEEPLPFDLPAPRGPCDRAAEDWTEALAFVQAQQKSAAPSARPASSRLQALTVRLVRGELPNEGERALRLFRAAADLAEHGTPLPVVRDLLNDPGLDAGLPPAEVARQIESGYRHGSEGKRDG